MNHQGQMVGGVKIKGENYKGANIMGRLLMELRDGKMAYKLPDDWNKMLAIIGGCQ